MREWNYENDQWLRLPSHLRHLPLFTQQFDLISIVLKFLWWSFLRFVFFKYYVRLKVEGDYSPILTQHPRLLVVANHASHLDAVAISTSIPFRFWRDLYFAAAKDYFFSNEFMAFFSKHCIGAIPIDRKDRRGGAVKLCLTLLIKLPRIWMVVFPEGTRSKDGLIHPFKKGVSVFSEKSNTPILFLYLDGPFRLWPKSSVFAVPGPLTVHVGPVHPPAPIDKVSKAYKEWVTKINSSAFATNGRPGGLPSQSEESEETDPQEPSE